MKKKSVLTRVYSAVVIVLGLSAYVLAHFFPDFTQKVGLGFLVGSKVEAVSTPFYDCELSWDWFGLDKKAKVSLSDRVEAKLKCQAHQNLMIGDLVVYVSARSRDKAGNKTYNRYETEGSYKPNSGQPIFIKAGTAYEVKQPLRIRSKLRKSKGGTLRKLMATGRVYSPDGAAAPFSEDLFIGVSVY